MKNYLTQNVNKMRVGDGHVVLLAGGGKIFTDIAARFCKSEKPLDELVNMPYSQVLTNRLATSPHKAVLEFDDFVFGVEGFARVTEVQLVRKRLASYMIKSGRCDKHGKRSYDVVLPDSVALYNTKYTLAPEITGLKDPIDIYLNPDILLDMMATWYNDGVDAGLPEEDLRYMKPQGTEFKAMIKMDAANLKAWWMIRMCNNAQTEIRDLATKMYKLANEAAPDLFTDAGPSCKVLGYCPEIKQCQQCTGKIPTKDEALEILKTHYKEKRG